jgi:hypothetical protein
MTFPPLKVYSIGAKPKERLLPMLTNGEQMIILDQDYAIWSWSWRTTKIIFGEHL